MGAAGECELWKNGMQKMKDCYCIPGTKVDKQALVQHRNTWIGRNRFWYDSKRGIPRNTQNPGNYSQDYERPNHLEESLKWKPIVGLRGGIPKPPAEPYQGDSRTRSKTTKKGAVRQNPRGAERQKSKEQRQKNIQEFNKWGLGSLKSKAASSAVAKKSTSSSAPTTTAALKRKRDSSSSAGLVEADESHIMLKRASSQPLLVPTRTQNRQADDHQSAEQHRLSLQTIRRNAELEEARIVEEKRLKVLREESEMETQRIKRMRQVEDKGNDETVKMLKWLRLSNSIKRIHFTL